MQPRASAKRMAATSLQILGFAALFLASLAMSHSICARSAPDLPACMEDCAFHGCESLSI